MPKEMTVEVDADDPAAAATSGDLCDTASEGEGGGGGGDDPAAAFALTLPKTVWETNIIVKISGEEGEPIMKCT